MLVFLLTLNSDPSCLLSLCLWRVAFSRPSSSLFSHAVSYFFGSPGDTVLCSSLTNQRGQVEHASVHPKATLCPEGGLPGHISMRPLGSVCTVCDKPGAPFAPYTLNRIMHPCLHRRTRSMGWTAHADSCQGDTLVQ